MNSSKEYLEGFWDREINWTFVKNKLPNYPNIAKVFTLKTLKEACKKPPYFCHPLVRWFGYNDKTSLHVFEQLLETVKNLKGVSDKFKLLSNPKEESWRFWSVRSELSVASFLISKCQSITLIEKDNQPDIQATQQGRNLYVEVYAQQKFYYRLFELEQILGEYLKKHKLRAYFIRDTYIKRKNITDDKDFLEIAKTCLEKLQDKQYLQLFRDNYQTILYEKANLNLCIYVENQENIDDKEYNPAYISARYGNGDENLYINTMLQEIVKSKDRDQKQLAGRSPNYLAVNVLFNEDLQMLHWDNVQEPINVVSENIDNIVFFTDPIDCTTIDVKQILRKQGC